MGIQDLNREKLLIELQQLKQENMESSSALKKHSKDFWFNRAVLVCAYSTISIGMIVLIGWSLGLIEIISLGEKYIPMAEEAALLFIITGIALIVIRRNNPNRIGHYFLICASGIIGIVAIIALFDFATSYKWNLSNFIGQLDVFKLRFLTGKMSPLTAICFLFLSTALIMLRTNTRKYSVIFSSLVLFTAYTIIVGYTYGVPFLYSGTTIPMAWLTAIAFIVSSAGLLLAAGKATAPVSYFMEDSTRSRMMRSILPVIFLAMLTHDFIDAFSTENVSSASALTNSIVDIFVLLATGFIISYISRSLGNSIDKNIAERKLAEAVLVEKDAQYRNLANSGPALIWTSGTDKLCNYFNTTWLSFTGRTLEQEIGNGWTEGVHPDDFDECLKTYLTSFELKVPFEMEYRLKHVSNEYRWILDLGTPNYNSTGEFIGYIGNCFDITERKKSEESLQMLSVAIENTKASIVITDNKGSIEYANPFFSQLTGYAPTEYLGKSPGLLKSGLHPAEFYSELWNTINSGRTWEGEIYNCKKNGEGFWENVIISPIRDLNNAITHFVAIKTDISESKLLHDELIRSKKKAEESDRLKSAFLSNMSHEIRTPMNGILGFAEMLKEPGLTTDQQQDYVRVINKSGVRMLNIINDIVDISKIESGLMKVDISKSNINEQIEYIHSFFKNEVERKGMQLNYKITLPAKEASIYTDREKLYAIFTNLVKNAIKYTDQGSIEFGYVPIFQQAHGVKDSTTGSVIAVGEPVELEFYVKDTGIGIQPDRQNAVFERFIQADISDSRAFQGAGLGLSIAKAYVEMLGGKIRVASESGKGSTFYFTLPYRHKSNEEYFITHDIQAEPVNKMIKKLKILVAEDDETSQELLSLSLQPIRYELQIVTTGVEAVEACRNHPDIDLVLMDIQMPVMDGYEATKEIRKFNKDIIIIAQTAFGLLDDRNMAIEAGCNDYISKPISSNQLHTVIYKHFQK